MKWQKPEIKSSGDNKLFATENRNSSVFFFLCPIMSEMTVTQFQNIKRVILLVSPSKEDGSEQWPSVEQTIAYECLSQISLHQIPEETYWCWLICTEQSEQTAKFLRQYFSSMFQFGDLPLIKGLDSAREIFELIMQIANNPLNSEQSIFCDCTGGTKTMSIAMALACTHYNLTTTSRTNLILTFKDQQTSDGNALFRKYDLSRVVAEEQRQYVEQQERIGRLRYLARLSPILAHEIKNPLNTINANLYSLRNKVDQQYSKKVVRMERAVTEISETIDNVQRIVRAESPDVYVPPQIPLVEIVQRLKARTERHFPDLTFSVKGKLERIHLKIPEEKLYTIFTNLIDNAAKATQGKGTVNLTFNCHQHGLSVSVEDDGPGIPRELRSHLFKPFYKGKDSAGTGIGLSIVKMFVLEEGGTISLDDTFERGARFIIELPCESHGDSQI
jgi:signal transduction histidine kinase